MSSITHIAPAAFTDPNKVKLYLDPVMNKGSVFLFDFLNPMSNPNPDDAVVADGTTYKNLVEGGGDGVFQQLGSGYPVRALAGKQGLQTAGQTGGNSLSANLSLGNPAPTADKAFMASLWFKSNGVAVAGTGHLLGDAVAVNGATGTTQWAWSLFAGEADTAQASQRLVGATALTAGPGPASKAVRQLALSWNAGQLTFYINGAVVASVAGIPSPIGATGRSPFIAFQRPGTYYRAYMERLDLSGRSALAAVQAEYAANNARFA